VRDFGPGTLRQRVAILGLVAAVGFAGDGGAQDLAIVGGRVMDPESGTDSELNVVVDGGRIVALTAQPVSAQRVLDAKGLVVAPGFIDLHAHGQDLPSNRFQVADGVTTALELEIGVYPVAPWYAGREGKALVHYGATVAHVVARFAETEPIGERGVAELRGAAFAGASAREPLDASRVAATVARLEEGLLDGALGIGFGITYTPGATHEEIFRAFGLAGRMGVPVFVHMRAAERMGGDRLAPVQEVIADAAATGASLHIVHLNSSTDEAARPALELIRAARARGVDVTTESYPYTAGSTRIESARFDDWQGDYATLQWAATGERLTPESFRRYRETGGYVILHGRSEATNEWLVAQPDVMVASDGISFEGGAAHPRGAGTFARILGHYVRDRGALELMTALRKMTLDPARRLEAVSPAMRRKGRIRVGADADLTIFDPTSVVDRATYTDSMRPSAGFRWVIVAGTPVIDGGRLVEGVFPGRPVYAERR